MKCIFASLFLVAVLVSFPSFSVAQIEGGWLNGFTDRIDENIGGIEFQMQYIERHTLKDSMFVFEEPMSFPRNRSLFDATCRTSSHETILHARWEPNPNTGYPDCQLTIKLIGLDTTALTADTVWISGLFADRPPLHQDWSYTLQVYNISVIKTEESFILELDSSDLAKGWIKFSDWKADPPVYRSGTGLSYKILSNARARYSMRKEPASVQKESSQQLALFPNPARSTVSVVCGREISEIRILNALGTQVRTIVRPSASTSPMPLQVDVNNLPAGVYLCQIVSEGSMSQQRFVISR